MCMRVSPSGSGNSGILFVGFNQDYGCFAVGMQNGFRIFNTDPLKQLERYEFDIRDGTGVGYLEMLFRTNLLGILGGGHHARLPDNVACLWDGIKQQFLLEITCATDVKAIRLRHDRIIIVLGDAIKVYTFGHSPQLVYESKTCPNPLGLCHVCQSPDNPLIVFPGRRIGSVLLVHIGNSPTNTGTTTTPSSTNATNLPPREILAHENAMASLTLNRDGSLLATASQKGTLIRIHSTKDCELLHVLRRGTNPATITCLSFNKESDLLCVTSERGTAHIFCLNEDNTKHGARPIQTGNNSPRAMKSTPSGSNKILPGLFFSTMSKIRCVLETKFKAICAFSVINPNTLIVLAADGSYYKYAFTANGSVTRITFVNFLDFYDDEADF